MTDKIKWTDVHTLWASVACILIWLGGRLDILPILLLGTYLVSLGISVIFPRSKPIYIRIFPYTHTAVCVFALIYMTFSRDFNSPTIVSFVTILQMTLLLGIFIPVIYGIFAGYISVRRGK